MKLAIVGTGYVGLVTGTCLAEIDVGNIICADIDDIKINNFKKGISLICKNNWKLILVDTGLNTMTCVRLKRIADLIGEDDFIFTYGDGFADININELIKFHIESRNEI